MSRSGSKVRVVDMSTTRAYRPKDDITVRLLPDAGVRRSGPPPHTDPRHPGFRNDACLPTRRYLNILLAGASAAGLDMAYVEALRGQPVLQKRPAEPWIAPAEEHPGFDGAGLARQPLYTALDHAVFDMSRARWQHRFLHGHFGGKDMTLFHLKRMDSSDGRETLHDVRQRRYTPAQRAYLDEFLHAYSVEYRYAGRFAYG